MRKYHYNIKIFSQMMADNQIKSSLLPLSIEEVMKKERKTTKDTGLLVSFDSLKIYQSRVEVVFNSKMCEVKVHAIDFKKNITEQNI